jgi:dephospho-CoA kinase
VLRVGLTGGIGSGKSTVAALFAELGVPVIDADQVARDLVEPGMPALAAIVKALGADVLRDGRLDRARLRALAFADPAVRETLETIQHPLIRDEIRRRVGALTRPYCIIAIPLLVEKGWQGEVDRVLVVDATPEQQIARTRARDGVDQATVERILGVQASRQERLARADDIIENNGDIATLRGHVTMAHRHYLALAGVADY